MGPIVPPAAALPIDSDCGQAYLSPEMARAIGNELITAAQASDLACRSRTAFEHHD
jgi:hypothetical protein